jgi:aminopeptidase-like protein
MGKVDMMELVEELWPLRRDLVSTGLSQALRRLAQLLPLKIESYPTGSQAWTWIIPQRWEVNRAWVKADGRILIDLADNPLHVMSYSQPIDRIVGRGELLAHIHTRADQPAAVPFEFSYYRPDWGFCVEHVRLDEFQSDEYEVLIDSHFSPGNLEVGTLHIPGSSSKEILLSAHLCHPAMANDDLSGVAVLAAVAQWLLSQQDLYYCYNILIGPETIGSLAFLSRHEDLIPHLEAGLFLEMLGHDDGFSLQRSRQGESVMDKALRLALGANGRNYREGGFRQVVRNDEAVINGPGVDVPCPSLSRAAFWSEGGLPFPEYHTSLDRPEIISQERLNEAVEVVTSAITMLESNYTPRRLFRGPVFLSRYDLWVDWRQNRELNAKSEEVMHLLEGDCDLLSIAQQSGVDFHFLKEWLDCFKENGLIEVLRL